MKTIEYNEMDKSDWGPGPWQGEPDKKQWQDAETGLPCLMVRNDFGALCGYVGVTPDHPWHGKDYGDKVVPPAEWLEREYGEVEEGACAINVLLHAHGGITFAGECDTQRPQEEAICHLPEKGEPDDLWWFGFDCSHSGDLAPATRDGSLARRLYTDDNDVYRDLAYLVANCAKLAKQLAEIVT